MRYLMFIIIICLALSSYVFIDEVFSGEVTDRLIEESDRRVEELKKKYREYSLIYNNTFVFKDLEEGCKTVNGVIACRNYSKP